VRILRDASRPRSIPQLSKNLQIVWSQRLLAQRAFFDATILSRVFNGAKVEWAKPQFQSPPGVSVVVERLS
jgi:hypothetical protein